jgi:hypothetical protein
MSDDGVQAQMLSASVLFEEMAVQLNNLRQRVASLEQRVSSLEHDREQMPGWVIDEGG